MNVTAEMSEPPEFLRFWGKARPKDGASSRFHPVAYHCLDVAAVASVLLQDAWHAPPEVAGQCRILTALMALHDIGKFSRPFQAKVEEFWPPSLGTYERRAGPPHDTAGFVLLRNPLADILSPLFPDWLPSDLDHLLRSITGHHGRPPEELTRGVGAEVMCAECVSAARIFAKEALGVIGACPFVSLSYRQLLAISWWLAGFAVLADWIGSNQAWFPYTAPDHDVREYWDLARARAERAVDAAGVLPAAVRSGLGFTDLAPDAVSPSPAQLLAGSLDLGFSGPVLALIEDQTGSGKTEAALLLAYRLMATGRARGLFVALPTMATANAMYNRLKASYRRLFHPETTPSLALAHSRRSLHPEFRKSILPGAGPFVSANDPADEPAEAQCAAWIADDRRLTFLADIGVGTIDQALLGVLAARHAALRLHGLASRVLIVDEAHAYDPYMQEEMLRLLQFQAALGGSAIVLSATLPLATRAKVVASFGRGTDSASVPSPSSMQYPLLTFARANELSERPCDPRPQLRRTVAVRRLATPDESVQAIADAAARNLAVAWVRNSVDDAIEGAAALRAGGTPATLFHARFAMADRLGHEADVLCRFGRHASAEQRCGVVVATQVIEQSLDLDFDLMVSDLAPIDLLVQRAGRLWRHERGPRLIDAPHLLLVGPEPVAEPETNWLAPPWHRTAAVYPRHDVLWRSARAILTRRGFTAPDDVRDLIEQVYASDEVPEALRAKSGRAEGKEHAARGVAHMNLLKWQEGYSRNAGPWEADVRTPTRLNDESIVLRLAHWDGGRVVPYAEADEPARAWALSEVSVRRTRAKGVPEPEGALKVALERALQTLSPWDRDVPVLMLSNTGEAWRGEVVRSDGKLGSVRYSRELGLEFLQ